jgi:peptidoglycan/LPS O-acetylase OafA/YrhL
LPLLAFILIRISKARTCLFIAFSSLAIMMMLLLALHDKTGASVTRLGIIRGFGGFVAGAALRRYVSLTSWQPSMPGLIATSSVLVIAALLFFPQLCILMPLAFASLIIALSFERGIVNAILTTPPAMFLGRISYSLYLVHYTPLVFLEWLFVSNQLPYSMRNVAIGLTVYVIIVLVLTIGLHYGVERPVQRAGRRLVASYDRFVLRSVRPPNIATEPASADLEP